MKNKTVHILMGLPASGKTYWASNYAKGNNRICHVNLDDALKAYTPLTEIIESYLKQFESEDYTELVLDGLFLNQSDVELRVLNVMQSINKVIIHFWREDRTMCLFNDMNRRLSSSAMTIRHTKLTKPNIKRLNKMFKQQIIIQYHSIVKKTTSN